MCPFSFYVTSAVLTVHKETLTKRNSKFNSRAMLGIQALIEDTGITTIDALFRYLLSTGKRLERDADRGDFPLYMGTWMQRSCNNNHCRKKMNFAETFAKKF